MLTMALVAGSVSADEKKEEKGAVVTLDGLTSRAPADWKETPTTSELRFKQFALPKQGDDKDDAELVIFFFGPGGGGGVQQNLERWKGMFQPPEGKKIDDVAKVEESKVGEVKLVYLDINKATYLYKARPFDPNAKAEPRPNYRMLAVIFGSPKGPYFLRVIGPEKTVTHHKKGFDEWLKNFK
jgi:hypothetical protein